MPIYRVGLEDNEITEAALQKSGLNFYKVENPREKFLTSIRSVLGKPYKWGASVLADAPEAFDCSSLTAWAAVGAGYAIPRMSIDQFVFAEKISKEELLPGDLIFANTGKIVHVGIRTESIEYMSGTKVPE